MAQLADSQSNKNFLGMLQRFASGPNAGALQGLVSSFASTNPNRVNEQQGGGGGLVQPGDVSAGRQARMEDFQAQAEFLRQQAAIPTPQQGAIQGSTSFAPGGPQLNFGGGSPFPVDPSAARLNNGLLLATRLLNAMKGEVGLPKQGSGQKGVPGDPGAQVMPVSRIPQGPSGVAPRIGGGAVQGPGISPGGINQVVPFDFDPRA